MKDLFLALKRLLEKNIWISIGSVISSILLFKLSDSPVALKIVRWLLPDLSSGFIEGVFAVGGIALFAASFGTFYIWIVAYDKKRRNKRRIALRQAAQSMKWNFNENPPADLRRQINSFIEDRIFGIPPHLQCTRQNVANVLSAEINGDLIAIFDIELSAKNDEGESSNYFETAAFIISDKLNLPYFQTQPEEWLGDNAVGRYLKNKAGVTDIEFPHRPVFSRKYVVDGKQEELFRLFTTPVFDFYEQNQLHRTIGREKMLGVTQWQTEPFGQAQINAQLQTLHNLYQLLKSN